MIGTEDVNELWEIAEEVVGPDLRQIRVFDRVLDNRTKAVWVTRNDDGKYVVRVNLEAMWDRVLLREPPTPPDAGPAQRRFEHHVNFLDTFRQALIEALQ